MRNQKSNAYKRPNFILSNDTTDTNNDKLLQQKHSMVCNSNQEKSVLTLLNQGHRDNKKHSILLQPFTIQHRHTITKSPRNRVKEFNHCTKSKHKPTQ